jgi:hypothetical protein
MIGELAASVNLTLDCDLATNAQPCSDVMATVGLYHHVLATAQTGALWEGSNHVPKSRKLPLNISDKCAVRLYPTRSHEVIFQELNYHPPPETEK